LKVRHNSFAIFDATTSSKMFDHRNWSEVKPGAKLLMSVWMPGRGFHIGRCPRCGAESDYADTFGWMKWYVTTGLPFSLRRETTH
jgi:hypothetical protein